MLRRSGAGRRFRDLAGARRSGDQAWGTPVLLTTRLASAEFAAISPDGSRVAFTSAQINIRAWVFPFDADRATPPGKGRPLTDEDAAAFGISASADGSSVFYAEGRPGRAALPGVRVSVDTGETTVLVDDAAKGLVPSPNGRSVSYLLQRPPGAAPVAGPRLRACMARRRRPRAAADAMGARHPDPDRRPPRRSRCPRDAADPGLWRPGPARRSVRRTGGRAAPRAARRRSEAVLAGPLFPRRALDCLRGREPRGRWSARARDRAVRQQQLVSMDADCRRSRLARQAPMVARRRYALLPVARGRRASTPCGVSGSIAPAVRRPVLHSGSRSSTRPGSTSIPTAAAARWASAGGVWSCRCGPSRAASGCCRTLVLGTKGGDRALYRYLTSAALR